MLRAEEGPAYWESPAPAVGMRLATPYAHHVQDCFCLTGFYAFHRPLYVNRQHSTNYSGVDPGYSNSSRSHTTVLVDFEEPILKLFSQGMITKGGIKMSKSRGNVVPPDELIRAYGADTERLYTLFGGPPDRDSEWSETAVEGSHRFLNRVWTLADEWPFAVSDLPLVRARLGSCGISGEALALHRKTHQTIKRVTGDVEDRFHFNTAISSVMELVNALYLIERPQKDDTKALAVVREAIETIILLMAPIVPHVMEELWSLIGYDSNLADAPWPAYDHEVAAEEEITIVIQVNGKVRSRVVVPADEDEETIKSLALGDEKIARFISGKTVVKEIYVPKKLVNIVIQE
jgi:leucyl-tRNA synthetase